MKGNKGIRKAYITFFVLLCAFLATFFGLVFAKYVKQQELNNSLTISAELGTLELKEHYAQRQPDGSYVLDMDTVLSDGVGNSYTLMPGVNVPKDPFVTIEKNSSLLPVYVYLKVQSTIENKYISYAIDTQNWKLVVGPTTSAGVTSSYYVYTGGTADAVEVTSSVVTGNELTKINILQNKEISVNRELLHGSDLNERKLVFSAAMFQTASGTNAVDVLNENRGSW